MFQYYRNWVLKLAKIKKYSSKSGGKKWRHQVRQSVARLRTSSHQLNIETGRYHNIPRQMRQCEFCLSQIQSTGPIEDEIHMLYKCKLVEELRRNALPRLTTLLHTKCGISANRFIIASMLPPPTIKIYIIIPKCAVCPSVCPSVCLCTFYLKTVNGNDLILFASWRDSSSSGFKILTTFLWRYVNWLIN